MLRAGEAVKNAWEGRTSGSFMSNASGAAMRLPLDSMEALQKV